MSSPDRMECSRKPAKCPACGHTPVATILWGLPDFDPELEAALKAGTVALGGCCISDDDPAWQCTACGQTIYRKAT